MGIPVADAALSTRRSSIVILIALIRILGNHSDGIQILISTRKLLSIVCTSLSARSRAIFPLTVVGVSVVFGTGYFSISRKAAALTLVSFGRLRLLMHINLPHLRIDIVL